MFPSSTTIRTFRSSSLDLRNTQTINTTKPKKAPFSDTKTQKKPSEFDKAQEIMEANKQYILTHEIGGLAKATVELVRKQTVSSFLKDIHQNYSKYNDYIEPTYQQYKQIVTELNVPEIHVRKKFLFIACRQFIEYTNHPILKDSYIASTHKTSIDKLNNALANWVMALVCVDDIADNIQNETLSHFFIQAFSIDASEEKNQKNLDSIKNELLGSFPKYAQLFTFYLDTWKASYGQIKDLLDPKMDADTPWKHIITGWQEVLKSIKISLQLNNNPEKTPIKEGKWKDIEEILSWNIMMEFTKVVERLFIQTIEPNRDLYPATLDDHPLFKKAQRVGKGANHLATWIREIQVNSWTNPIFYITEIVSQEVDELSIKNIFNEIKHTTHENNKELVQKAKEMVEYACAPSMYANHLYKTLEDIRKDVKDIQKTSLTYAKAYEIYLQGVEKLFVFHWLLKGIA